ncbi:unnamed protein product [Closterium sp. Yama58-4]|nr:unnamed protein product [Closterium sp. Yama58-4]
MEATREDGPPVATKAAHTSADIDLNLDEAMEDLEMNDSEEDAAKKLQEDAGKLHDNAKKQQDAEAASVEGSEVEEEYEDLIAAELEKL